MTQSRDFLLLVKTILDPLTKTFGPGALALLRVHNLSHLRVFRHAHDVTGQRVETFVLEEAEIGWKWFRQASETVEENQ